MSEVVLIGGANGAGKSTLARLLLPPTMPFLNADQIAETLPPDHSHPEREAGRLLLEHWHNLAARRRSFAIETTLASRSLAPRLRCLSADGWRIYLIFIASPSPELNIARVACRVAAGGHAIPEPVIRRRYESGGNNFTELYRPLADSWHLLCNSGLTGPELRETGGKEPASDLSPVFGDSGEIHRRFTVAVRETMVDHARHARTVAMWEGGHVVYTPAADSPLTSP